MFRDFEPSGEYISKKLCGTISINEAEQSLRFLLSAEFIKIDELGKYQLNDPVLSTGADTFLHSELQSLHSQVLTIWAKNLEKLIHLNRN